MLAIYTISRASSRDECTNDGEALPLSRRGAGIRPSLSRRRRDALRYFWWRTRQQQQRSSAESSASSPSAAVASENAIADSDTIYCSTNARVRGQSRRADPAARELRTGGVTRGHANARARVSTKASRGRDLSRRRSRVATLEERAVPRLGGR